MVTFTGDDVGTLLRIQRESLGLKLEDAARTIRVRSQYLEAIESSYYEDVPALVYLLGYVRQYAEFLHLNAQDVIDKFKAEQRTYHRLHEVVPVIPIQEDHRPKIAFILLSVAVMGILCLVWQLLLHRTYYFDRLLPIPRALFENASTKISGFKKNVHHALEERKGNLPHRASHGASAGPSHGPSHGHTTHTKKAPPHPTGAPSVSSPQPLSEATPVQAPPTHVVAEATPLTPPEAPRGAAVQDVAPNGEHSPRLILFAKGTSWVKVMDQNNQLIAHTVLSSGDTYFAPAGNHVRILAENPALIEVYTEDSAR